MSMPSGNGHGPGPDRKSESAAWRESGLEGLTCPICGRVFERLQIKVRRRVNDYEERLNVCSEECADRVGDSPFVQTSLFGGDLGVWTRSVQSELELNGDGSASAEEE